MQAINPVLVLTLIPLFEAYIYPVTSYLLGFELTPLRKMSSGMLLAGFSFLYVAGIQVHSLGLEVFGWEFARQHQFDSLYHPCIFCSPKICSG